MTNRFFTASMLKVLLNPQAWKFAGTRLGPDVRPVQHPAHRRWMKRHSHSHAHREVLLVLRGAGQHGLGGKVFPRRPGMVCLLEPLESHDSGYRTAEESDLLWFLIFRNQLVVRLLAVRRGKPLPRQVWRLIFTEEELGISPDQLLSACAAGDGTSPALDQAALRSAISLLITLTVRRILSMDAPQSKESFQRGIISAVERHIRETAGRDLSLESLARIAGYSKYHFVRMFKKHTGRSVHQYIDACRAERMAALLKEGYRISAISAALGFSQPSAFARWRRLRRRMPWKWKETRISAR